MSTRCQVLLPGLFDLPIAELPDELLNRQLPILNRLLRLASTVDNRLHTIDASIAAALGLHTDPLYCLPLARAFAVNSGRDHLLVEAVHLHADLQNAVLIPVEKDQRFFDEISILINDLNDVFNLDCYITVVSKTTCLMRLETLTAPSFYPHPLSVLGKPANPYVEQSRQNLPWYRLLNEIQMFLHQHPVNQQRQLQGLLSINSLWCWGGGPSVSLSTNYDWFCDDEILNRFVESLGMRPNPVSHLKSANELQQTIIVDLSLLEAAKVDRGKNLATLLLDIEAHVLGPALDLFDGSLRLRCACELDFQLHSWSRLKFWRSQRNLQDWQQQLQSRAVQYS